MGAAFWTRRFLLALTVAFAILFGAELAKGHSLETALRFAALWGIATGAVFTLASYVRYKRHPGCWLPDDPGI